jgi:hypothetical protein
MDYFIKLLGLLQGKKTTIVALISLILSYCAFKGVIGNAELVLAQGIMVILGAGANIATSRFLPIPDKP